MLTTLASIVKCAMLAKAHFMAIEVADTIEAAGANVARVSATALTGVTRTAVKDAIEASGFRGNVHYTLCDLSIAVDDGALG